MQTVCAFKDWNSATHFLDGAEMAHGVGIGYDGSYGPVERRDEKERREGHSGLRVLLRAQRQVEPQLLHLGDQLEPGLQRRTGGGGAGRLRDLSGRRAKHHRQGDRKQRLGHARDVQPRRQLPRRLRLLGLRNGLRVHHARGDGVVHGDRQRSFGRRRFQKDRQMDSLHGGYEQNGVQLLRLRAFEHRLPAAVVSRPQVQRPVAAVRRADETATTAATPPTTRPSTSPWRSSMRASST